MNTDDNATATATASAAAPVALVLVALGMVVQVDPIKPTSKVPGTNQALETEIRYNAFKFCFQFQVAPLHLGIIIAACRPGSLADLKLAGPHSAPPFHLAAVLAVFRGLNTLSCYPTVCP